MEKLKVKPTAELAAVGTESLLEKIRKKVASNPDQVRCFRLGSTGLISSNGATILFPDKYGNINRAGFYKTIKPMRDMKTYLFVDGEPIRFAAPTMPELVRYCWNLRWLTPSEVSVVEMKIGDSTYDKIVHIEGDITRTQYVGVAESKFMVIEDLCITDPRFEQLSEYEYSLYASNVCRSFDALSEIPVDMNEYYEQYSVLTSREIDLLEVSEVTKTVISATLFEEQHTLLKDWQVFQSSVARSMVKIVNVDGDAIVYNWSGHVLTRLSAHNYGSIPFDVDVTDIIHQSITGLMMSHGNGSHPYGNMIRIDFCDESMRCALKSDESIVIQCVNAAYLIKATPLQVSKVIAIAEKYFISVDSKIRTIVKGLPIEEVGKYNYRKI